MILFHIHDDRRRPPASRRLEPHGTILAVPLDAAADVESVALRNCLFDVDVTNAAKALRVRAVVARMQRGGRRIFVCGRGDHHAVTQARALGATDVIDRPDDLRALQRILREAVADDDPPASVVVGAIALDVAFASIVESKQLPSGHMERVASSVGADIGELGIEDWLQSIRAHHAGTYQHCLIVTGLANAFGRALNLSPPDLERLTVAALLHDIGKAQIDLAILDKTGALSPEERRTIEMHPGCGEQHLRRHGTVDEEILDGVRHHHEMLDGSGYPDRLRGDEISDLTRLLTIVDIFGALVERRAYKPPMSGEAAFAIIGRMADEGKLEKALVEAFRPVAAQLRDEPALNPP